MHLGASRKSQHILCAQFLNETLCRRFFQMLYGSIRLPQTTACKPNIFWVIKVWPDFVEGIGEGEGLTAHSLMVTYFNNLEILQVTFFFYRYTTAYIYIYIFFLNFEKKNIYASDFLHPLTGKLNITIQTRGFH